ncbi:MAG: sensor histidine kinase, partial [Alphaproteobacteria bacterium]
IDNILDLAVIEAGAMSLDIVEVPIEALLDDVLALSREQARKAGLEVLVKTADNCGTIECDQRRLKQAIYNLVTNAIKFTPRGGRLTLLARPAGEDEVEIIVRDTGIGIDEKERVAVFEKFYTGSSASGRKGVGLGLSLVQSFIELHRGRIALVSRPNEGTTVTCTLPRRQARDARLRQAI